jgi:HD-GYP domain-containing protein (c-di-GMP phosphodiesterase class II)
MPAVETIHRVAAGVSGSLGEQLRQIHDRILESYPHVARVACALYDERTDLLKTYINSTRAGTPIEGYEFTLAKSASLSALAESGECRVINDIRAVLKPDNEHSRWVLEQGYQSSLTVPMHLRGQFLGMIFFDSLDRDAFDARAQRDLIMQCNLVTLTLANARDAVRTVLASAEIATEFAHLRDYETGTHLDRMALYARLIARHIAPRYGLSDETIEHIYLFAPLHDVGKIGIPDRILKKPGPLDEAEWAEMKTHVEKGVSLIERVIGKLGVETQPDSQVMLNIVAGHHEMLDGSGYPKGLAGDAVPVEARIITVADIFDALVTRRCYKEPWTLDAAFEELERLVGQGKLDEHCVAALVTGRAEVEAILEAYPAD